MPQLNIVSDPDRRKVARLLISRGAIFAQSWIEPDHLEDDRRRAGAEALNEPQQLHGLTVRPRATTATY